MTLAPLTEPTRQEHRNPLKWGWYYVEQPDGTMTGLMDKRSARKLLKRGGIASYGTRMGKHSRAPNNLLRYITFPLKTG